MNWIILIFTVIRLNFNELNHLFSLPSRPRRYPCSHPDCSMSFFRKYKLMRHLETHSNVMKFECEICSRKFKRMDTLKGHRLTHTQLRPHRCPYCEKGFNTSNILKSHIGLHTGELPFSCGLCPSRFLNSSGAAVHRRIHTVNNLFHCTLCTFEVKRYDALVRHTNQEHSGMALI